jgi:hypothetical protein
MGDLNDGPYNKCSSGAFKANKADVPPLEYNFEDMAKKV